LLGGRFHDWNAALNRVPKHLMKPQNRAVLMLFAKATNASLLNRLIYLKRSGVIAGWLRRQSSRGSDAGKIASLNKAKRMFSKGTVLRAGLGNLRRTIDGVLPARQKPLIGRWRLKHYAVTDSPEGSRRPAVHLQTVASQWRKQITYLSV
jgi:hypothetical protein